MDAAVDGKTVFGAPAGHVSRIRAGNERLRRNASCIHARPAELVSFDDGDTHARRGKARCQRGTGLARTDDDRVEFLHDHKFYAL